VHIKIKYIIKLPKKQKEKQLLYRGCYACLLNDMPKRIIKKIKDLGKEYQKTKTMGKKTKAIKKKTEKVVSRGIIQEKIDKIKDQRKQIVYERSLKKKEKRIKKELNQFARKKKSLKDDYKTRFPIFGRGKDEDAQEVESYESRLSMEHQLELELQRVQRALGRVSEKKYGFCLVCGKKIQSERLKIYPEAEYCMACQRKKGTD